MMLLVLPAFRALPIQGFLARIAAFAGTVASAPGTASEDDEDQCCMARLAEGDAHALRPIFDRWKLPLLSWFYRALGSRADAEDLTLRVFERVYRAAPRYRPEAKFSTWLFAIARRELLHELRRRRRKPLEPVDPGELGLAGGEDPRASLRLRELEESLLAALARLPERQRTAVTLAAAGDLSHGEIASILNVSENNLYVILHRARSMLREYLESEQP